MNINSELSTISKISDQIYLSGIDPLYNINLIKSLEIKYIISCIDYQYTNGVHDAIIENDQDIVVLYIPYLDSVEENLWKNNKGDVKIYKYVKNGDENYFLNEILYNYKNKPYIEIAYNFMDLAINNGSKILIHCMAGISRSVSMIAYYLMKKYFINFDEALNIIKTRRSIANPNNSFKLQLQVYGKMKQYYNEKISDEIIYKNFKI